MAQNSNIEWTDATWNPVTGCTKISSGCDNCYAERFSERFRGVKDHPFETGFDLTLRPARLEQPLAWKKPRMIFVNSMSDLFHKKIPYSYVDKVFDTMEEASHHTFQVLTKRSSRLRTYINKRYKNGKAPSNIWLGVSVEDASKKSRITHLSETNATVRFLSIEPLIGPMGPMDLSAMHWIIVGGESGPHHRPIKETWVTDIRDQCLNSKVPFFFKQWGGFRPKENGRELEGRIWGEYPTTDDHSPIPQTKYVAAE